MSMAGDGIVGGIPFLLRSLALCHSPVAAKMHGKLEHASHEDCVVTHAGPIHRPGVNIMRVGAYDNIPECPVHCQCHIRMSIEGI